MKHQFQTQAEDCTQFAIPTLKVKKSVSACIQTKKRAHTHTQRQASEKTLLGILAVNRFHLVTVACVELGKASPLLGLLKVTTQICL